MNHPSLHRVAKRVNHTINPPRVVVPTSISYSAWIRKVEPTKWETLPESAKRPLISIVVPTFNTPEKYIAPLIESLVEQTYSNWELILADGSTDNERKKAIEKYAKEDKRIIYKAVNTNLGISGNTNVGIEATNGIFVGLLDHDDALSPHAIEEVVIAYNKRPQTDIIYSDEDKLSDDGKYRLQPFFKPDWSPDLLLGVNYITHFLVVKKTLINKVGGLRSEFDGAQDYDFLLRLTEQTDDIFHIPKMLYHWRQAVGSTAIAVGEKKHADTAGQRALAEAVTRRNIAAEVIGIPERPTSYRLKYKLPKKQPKVSIIIPFNDKPDLLARCVDSIIEKTSYKNYELILLSNNSVEALTHKLLDKYRRNKHCKVFIWDHPFNYSKINNFGVSEASGEYIVLLSNDTEIITHEWLDELIGVAMQPGVGAVGPTLYYPDKKNGIQHAGIVLGMGAAGHVFRHRQFDEWTDFGLPQWPRNYLAVTGACLAVKKSRYDQVGGLDELFQMAGSDIALCLRLHEAGYKNIYWPFASLYNFESISYNSIQGDYDRSLKYYKPYHESGDPYFNKNLDLMNEDLMNLHVASQCLPSELGESESVPITDMLARFFDPDWYSVISNRHFGASTRTDHYLKEGIDHYVTEGWRLYLSPSPYFDAKFYLAQIDGFECCEVDALTCFLEHGEARGDKPHPLIDPKWIRRQLDQDSLLDVDADYCGSVVLWYIETGWKTGIRPHPLFWSDWYRTRYSVNTEPLVHYISTGHCEGNYPNPLFDTQFYALSMEGRLGGLDPLSHYVLFGYRELASPHRLVDLPFVAERLGLVAPVSNDLLADYLAGQSEVEPSFYIDPQYYWNRAGEPTRFAIVNGKKLALVDFAERNGAISPHPHFSSSWYLKQRGDVRAAGLNPLSHYLASGWRERTSPHPLFETNYYLSAYPDVLESGKEPLRHFLTSGWREGRKARAPQPPNTSVRRYRGMEGVYIGQDAHNIVSHGRAPDTSRFSVGVFAHVFYEELATDFAELANRIRPPCQVFITTDQYAKARIIRQAFLRNCVHDFEIRVTPNRGRDIAPMLIGYKDRLKSVDIGLHLHTKRSKHYVHGRDDWRDYLMRGNAGTKMIVDNTLALFANTEIGAVAPKDFQPISPQINWGKDFAMVSGLLSLVGETIHQDSLLEFASGSMFWFRTAALADLVDLGLDLAHFDPEEAQIDGTLAHAIERAFFYFVEYAGYGWIRTQLAAPGAAQQVNLEDLPVVRINPPQQILRGISAHFPECSPFAPRRAQSEKPRLNLVLPTVEPDRAYGGVATALEMYKALLQAFDGRVDGRMICTDNSLSDNFVPLADHIVVAPTGGEFEDANVVLDGKFRVTGTYYLDVRRHDFFLVSAWWNAAAALEIIDWQRRCFPETRSKLLYMVQDFEPGFYPWSTRYVLAQATYLQPEVTIPIFNTPILADSFRSRGFFHATTQFVLQPGINRGVTGAISRGTAKERIVLLYLRPEVVRNCYEFIDALVYQVTSCDEKYWSNWRFVAVGEDLAASPFKCSDSIEVLGKLSLSEYGQLLSRSAIGVSLMISPHPSYPPLEMAEAGMRVITNSYENKNLSALHENITSFDRFDMDEVAVLLTNIAQRWETDPQAGWRSKPKVDWFFGSQTNLPKVAAELADLLEADWRARAAEIPFPEEDLFLPADISELYAWRETDEQAVCASQLGRPAEAFALCRRLLGRPDLPEPDRQRIAANRDVSVPAMLEAASAYPEALVQSLAAGPGQAEVVVSLIAGPDRETTEQTLNSFLNCCLDVSRVGRFVVLDAGLSAADRARMRKRYGFLEFARRRSGDKPAPLLAQLRAQIDGRFWLHLGEGWRFFAPENFITRLTAVLEAEPQVFQVGINFDDAVKLTGVCAAEEAVRRAPDTGRYLLTEAMATGPAMFDTARLDRARGVQNSDPDPPTQPGRPAAGAELRTASLDEVLCISDLYL